MSSSSSVFDEALNGIDMSGKGNSSTAPRAFLNYIFFDQEMNYVRAGFLQITTAAQGIGVYETISLNDIIADCKGYLLAYLSNENAEEVAIHWDDFTVYHGKTNVVSADSYYPFGGQFNLYQRTASERVRYLFNGNEWMPKLNLYDFNTRTYDPWVPRFLQLDPMADEREWLSPYNFAQMNPVNRVDPSGMLDDWYTDANNELVYNENITSQTDLNAVGIEGTYRGKEAFAINETTGDLQHYQADGTIREAPMIIGLDVTVYGNPIEAAVYQGQDKFVDHPVTQGAFMVATSVIPLGPAIKGFSFLKGTYLKLAPKVSTAINNNVTKAVLKTDFKLNQVKRVTMRALTPSKRTYVKMRSLNSTTRSIDKSLRSFYTRDQQFISTPNVKKALKTRDDLSNLLKFFDN